MTTNFTELKVNPSAKTANDALSEKNIQCRTAEQRSRIRKRVDELALAYYDGFLPKQRSKHMSTMESPHVMDPASLAPEIPASPTADKLLEDALHEGAVSFLGKMGITENPANLAFLEPLDPTTMHVDPPHLFCDERGKGNMRDHIYPE